MSLQLNYIHVQNKMQHANRNTVRGRSGGDKTIRTHIRSVIPNRGPAVPWGTANTS